MKRLLISLALTGTMLAIEPVPSQVHNGVPRQYTDDEVETFANTLKPPQGATVVDVGQRLNAALASMNQYETGANSHLGFSIYILEPKAWIGVQKAKTIKHFETFDTSKLTENSREAILRVFVRPDLPTSALATWAANNAEHVVIRSTDKKLVAQPLSIKESSESVQNIFGAQWSYAGLEATFSMADLDEIRRSTGTREFLVTIVGEKKNTNRDFRIKPKFFQEMGD